MQDVLYTVAEVSQLLKVNRNYVYTLIDKGYLKALKLGALKVRKSSLDDFLEKNDGMDFSDLNDIKSLKGDYTNEKVQIN